MTPTGEHALPGHFEGALVRFRRIELTKDPAGLKGEAKAAHERLVTTGPCSECDGARLNAAARAATVCGLTLPQAYALQVDDLARLVDGWDLGALEPLRADVVTQLRRLVDLGLGYLHLARDTATLSGGEAQRVKMVRHLGSTLNDMLYVFDEPTTGLHARDVERLARMLTTLRDQGNTVLVVEHDPAVMAIADRIVEIGPGAGRDGGRLLYDGSFEGLRGADTVTGRALAGRPRAADAHPDRRDPPRPRAHPQPQGRHGRRAPGRPHGRHRRRGLRQVEPHPRPSPGRGRGGGHRGRAHRPGTDPRLPPVDARVVDRDAR